LYDPARRKKTTCKHGIIVSRDISVAVNRYTANILSFAIFFLVAWRFTHGQISHTNSLVPLAFFVDFIRHLRLWAWSQWFSFLKPGSMLLQQQYESESVSDTLSELMERAKGNMQARNIPEYFNQHKTIQV
jgi:hypothetical protein